MAFLRRETAEYVSKLFANLSELTPVAHVVRISKNTLRSTYDPPFQSYPHDLRLIYHQAYLTLLSISHCTIDTGTSTLTITPLASYRNPFSFSSSTSLLAWRTSGLNPRPLSPKFMRRTHGVVGPPVCPAWMHVGGVRFNYVSTEHSMIFFLTFFPLNSSSVGTTCVLTILLSPRNKQWKKCGKEGA
jgi:hypothetical protein